MPNQPLTDEKDTRSTEAELISEIARQGQEITRLRLGVGTGRDRRIAAALTVCDQVEANPVGWGGPMAVSLARTIRPAPTRPIPSEGDDADA